MKTIIVEDKAYVRKAFLGLLNLIDNNINVIGECETVADAVTVTKSCKPELVFLDINLPDGNAFDFLAQTQELSYKVIFITAHEEFALKALKAGAVDYLLKPIDIDDLKLALQKIEKSPAKQNQESIIKAHEAFNQNNSKLILSLQDSYQIINIRELVYCKSDKGYTTFYLNDNKRYIASKSMKEFESKLIENGFTRPHQSYMVNLKFVDKYDKSGTIHLKNNQKIPVSVRKKESFISKLFQWNS